MSEPVINVFAMTPDHAFRAGEQLRRARRIVRLSQRELAERAGVPPATLARIESGATANPGIAVLTTLFGALGFRLALVAANGAEVAEHPWEQEFDHGGRHLPAHLDLWRVGEPYFCNWHGWYRSWAWRPDAPIPKYSFYRRTRMYQLRPLDPATGEPLDRDRGP